MEFSLTYKEKYKMRRKNISESEQLLLAKEHGLKNIRKQ